MRIQVESLSKPVTTSPPISQSPSSWARCEGSVSSINSGITSSLLSPISNCVRGVLNFCSEWIQWCIGLCLWPFIPSKLEILEDILDAPKEMAKQLSKHPDEAAHKLILAALEDPVNFEKECTTKEKSWESFLKEFKSKTPTTFLNETKELELIKRTISAHLINNPNALRDAVSEGCSTVISSTSKSTELLSKKLTVVFTGLQKILTHLNDKDIHDFVLDMTASQTPRDFSRILNTLPINSLSNKEAFKKALTMCTESNCSAFIQLQDDTMTKAYLGLNSSINLRELFVSLLFKHATPKQFKDAADDPQLKEKAPIASLLLAGLGGYSRSQRQAIAQNFERSFALLAKLQGQYQAS